MNSEPLTLSEALLRSAARASQPKDRPADDINDDKREAGLMKTPDISIPGRYTVGCVDNESGAYLAHPDVYLTAQQVREQLEAYLREPQPHWCEFSVIPTIPLHLEEGLEDEVTRRTEPGLEAAN